MKPRECSGLGFMQFVAELMNRMPSFWNEGGIRVNADLSSTLSVSAVAGFAFTGEQHHRKQSNKHLNNKLQ